MTKISERKDDLEKEKLGLEIEELKKPFWKKFSFYAVFGPTMLAFGTIVTGMLNYYTGAFDARDQLAKIQFERALNEKILLTIEGAKLRDEITKLRGDVEHLRSEYEIEKKGSLNRSAGSLTRNANAESAEATP